MNLEFIYNESIAEIPSSGRYSVLLEMLGSWQIVLEKTISINSKGQNHPPVFLMRHFNLPFMDFRMFLDNNEIVFRYSNGFLIDRLKKRKDKNEWIGKIYIDGKFIRYFKLRRK